MRGPNLVPAPIVEVCHEIYGKDEIDRHDGKAIADQLGLQVKRVGWHTNEEGSFQDSQWTFSSAEDSTHITPEGGDPWASGKKGKAIWDHKTNKLLTWSRCNG